jgi:hypothetical protein
VLAAAVHKRRTGRLTVLDVMAGSGMRGARYLLQVAAGMRVWRHQQLRMRVQRGFHCWEKLNADRSCVPTLPHAQAQADLVWCNDHDRRTHDTLCNNLVSVLQQQQQQGQDDGDIAEGVQALERAARRLQYPGKLELFASKQLCCGLCALRGPAERTL